ncbi:MAG: hypothetical protein LBH91_01590 [Prevotellaceae bacterium]|nr:hypothetical protein [Prevotellaceae bacterium]
MNNLNLQIKHVVDDKYNNTYTFDKRGYLVEGVYKGNGSNANWLEEKYVYDATNRMVKGTKYLGTSVDYEDSYYIYNGLGYLVGNEWVIAKNG